MARLRGGGVRRLGALATRPRPDSARSVPIRWSLLGSMLLLLALLSGAIATVSALGERRTVQTLSRGITEQTIAQTIDRLERFVDPITSSLLLLRSWGEAGLLDGDPEALDRLLVPVMRPHTHISALLIADERGRYHILLRSGDRWQSAQMRRDEWGARRREREWTDGDPTPVRSSSEVDFDPRTRPWYRGAVEGLAGAAAVDSPAPAFVHWTEPYAFFTQRAPGVTASTTFRAAGRQIVVAVDVLLTEVSAYTGTLRPSAHGIVVALTDAGRVIGVPDGVARGVAGPGGPPSSLLPRPEEVGLGVVVQAMAAIAAQGKEDRGPARFVHAGAPWWGAVRKFALGGDRALSVAVLVPEADIVGALGGIRWWILVLTAAALGLAVVWAVRLALRYSRPIEVLARENERIGLGDLEEGPPVRSSVTEVQRLVRAHDRMRVALRTLFKVERDLQLARQIQHSTLPAALPALAGFEVDAWFEPADATAGDAYDVVAMRARRGGAGAGGEEILAAADGPAERAVLFLADADGHGIGPALSVTLARAMLRMGLRAGLDLPAIVRRMNAQLADDLRDGHFVTAWFGALDVRARTLTCVCCGHGPVLHYVAATDECRVIPADTVPLGVLPDIDPGVPAATALGPGDVVVVMSDGVFDANSAAGESFGSERVTALLRAHRGAPAAEILAAVRGALDAFTAGAPAEDDRTAIVLARRA